MTSKATGRFKRLEDVQKQGFRADGSFGCLYDAPMSKKIYGARLPQDIADYIESKPHKTDWIREMLIKAAREEMKDAQ